MNPLIDSLANSSSILPELIIFISSTGIWSTADFWRISKYVISYGRFLARSVTVVLSWRHLCTVAAKFFDASGVGLLVTFWLNIIQVSGWHFFKYVNILKLKQWNNAIPLSRPAQSQTSLSQSVVVNSYQRASISVLLVDLSSRESDPMAWLYACW